MLLGLLRASDGEARLLGGDPWRDAVALHRRLAYVPGDVNLWPKLTGGEAIDLLGRLRGGLDPRRRDELLERFELDPTKKGRAYSKGNRQKVALVAALASDAELLMLDEPTSGSTRSWRRSSSAASSELRGEGRTVLLSSHILAEVEALCDRVTIIRAGKHGRDRHAGRAAPPHPHLDRGRDRAASRAGPRRAPGRARPPCRGPPRALRRRHQPRRRDRRGGSPSSAVRSLTSTPPTLEELFLRHYGDEIEAVSGAGRHPRRCSRCALRRERVRIPVYVVLFVAAAASRPRRRARRTYPTPAARAAYVATVEGNPGLIAMVGPPYDR